MKMKARYIAAALMVAASAAVTPLCIDAAYQARGYEAVGGEWLVIPLGIILAFLILEAAKTWDYVKYKLKKVIEETFGDVTEYDGIQQSELEGGN